MKCQILFVWKNKKNIINLSSAENAQRVVKVNPVSETDSSISAFDTYIDAKRVTPVMANSVDPDKMAHEPTHLDLHCLQKYLSWSTGLND